MLSVLNLIIIPIFGILSITAYNFHNSSLKIKADNAINKNKKNNVLKSIAMYAFTLNFFFSFYYLYFFEKLIYGFQFVGEFELLNFTVRFGIDGISLFFLLLTTFLLPICLLLSWDYISKNVYVYLMSLLFLEFFLILFFSSLNILILFVSFESILIPMFIIIGLWGGFRKIKANYYFFIYTLAGSVFMLLGILILWTQIGSLDFITILSYKFYFNLEKILWLLFFIGFAVKIPIFPTHL